MLARVPRSAATLPIDLAIGPETGKGGGEKLSNSSTALGTAQCNPKITPLRLGSDGRGARSTRILLSSYQERVEIRGFEG
jgi:hypothetical protein